MQSSPGTGARFRARMVGDMKLSPHRRPCLPGCANFVDIQFNFKSAAGHAQHHTSLGRNRWRDRKAVSRVANRSAAPLRSTPSPPRRRVTNAGTAAGLNIPNALHACAPQRQKQTAAWQSAPGFSRLISTGACRFAGHGWATFTGARPTATSSDSRWRVQQHVGAKSYAGPTLGRSILRRRDR